MCARATEKDSAVPPRPPFWFRLSITAGNLAQLAGLVLGSAVLYTAAHLQAAGSVRVVLMLGGWFAIYVCCHAIAHWLVGRLVGIEFQGYGLRGTDHPENYPPGLRQAMSALPTFTVIQAGIGRAFGAHQNYAALAETAALPASLPPRIPCIRGGFVKG